MAKIEDDFRLPQGDVHTLNRLIGATWQGFGVPDLANGQTEALESLFIDTSLGSITIAAVPTVATFSGYPDDMAPCRIESGAPGRAKAEQSGSLFIQGRGSRVMGIETIDDECLLVEHGQEKGHIVMCSGLVITTTEIAFGVWLESPHTEVLTFTVRDANTPLEVPEPRPLDADDLESQYLWTRRRKVVEAIDQ